MKSRFRAGVIQFDVSKGQIDVNMQKVICFLERLADEKVSLAVLPEMFSCSFDNENLTRHAGSSPDIVAVLSGFARKSRMAISGTLPEREAGRVFNVMVFIDADGMIKGRYRKLHLFRLTGEHHYYTPGDRMVLVDSSLGRIGLMTCYDLRFPELARGLFLSQASVILVSAQWPDPRKAHWTTLIQARAIENQLFVIGSNRIGKEDELVFPGLSRVVDPMGRVLAEAGGEEGCISAEIDPETIRDVRTLIPCMTDRRPDIYG